MTRHRYLGWRDVVWAVLVLHIATWLVLPALGVGPR